MAISIREFRTEIYIMKIVEDENELGHIIHKLHKESEDYYNVKCARKIPEGRYYNGEFESLEDREKNDVEITEVSDAEEFEGSVCEECLRVNNGESLVDTDIPPAKYPLLSDTEDNVEVNRTGKPSKLERRLARVSIAELKELADNRGVNEKFYDIHVDAGGGHLFVGLRINHKDVMLSREEINKTYQRIQESHNFSRGIGDISIHSGYEEDDYYLVAGYSWIQKEFVASYYREYGRKPHFVEYDEHKQNKSMNACRVVFD